MLELRNLRDVVDVRIYKGMFYISNSQSTLKRVSNIECLEYLRILLPIAINKCKVFNGDEVIIINKMLRACAYA